MVPDTRDATLADIARKYSLRPLSMSRVYAGCGTRNWSLRAAEGRFFVKEYSGHANADEERQALELSMFARDCGIPTPRVIATRSEDLICTCGDTMFALFEWADGCTATRSLSPEQMAQAGGVLGDIHRHFSTIESPLPSQTSRWLGFDAADKLREVERYVEIIRRKAEPDDFDRRTLRPVELQESLDRFWFQRAHAARTLFANLVTVQETLKSVWETSAGDGRTG